MPTERKCSVCDFCSVEKDHYKCMMDYIIRDKIRDKVYTYEDICIACMFLDTTTFGTIEDSYKKSLSPDTIAGKIFKDYYVNKCCGDIRREVVLRMYRNGNPSIKNIPLYMANKARWNKKVPDIYGYLESINKAIEVIEK